MSYSAEQIEKGCTKQIAGKKSRKYYKKCQHRRLRRKIKADINFVPQYNRYEAGWEL